MLGVLLRYGLGILGLKVFPPHLAACYGGLTLARVLEKV